MLFKNSSQKYGCVTKFFHWTIALLVIFQFTFIYSKEYALPKGSELGKFLLISLHKPLGVITLVMVICAVLWKIFNKKPQLPSKMSTWQVIISKVTHIFLYLSALVMASSGLIMSMAAGYTVNMFNLYKLPQFIEKNKELGKISHNIHGVFSYILLVLIILHFLAALEHHFIEKDNILKRMLPFYK